MSPRAAWRLERLGFDPVYDYVGGKVDWMAAGLGTVRSDTSGRRAIDAADRNPPTCSPDTPVADLPAGVQPVVVDDQRIVLGRVGPDRHDGPGRTAEQVMAPGPATVRAHEPLGPLLERMERGGVADIVVTTPEGRLLGVVRRQ